MRKTSVPACSLFVAAAMLFTALTSWAQGSSVRPLITQPIDEAKLTVIRGNTHPLARPQFDKGPAPSDLAMDRMLLVMKRTPEQQAALDKLSAEQQDKSSPNYHKWLTPAEFGKQFGPSDQDMQTVTNWLQSHGFSKVIPATGRTTIEFSGTAAQVQQAFHTSIHRFVVRGEEHWANVKDPSIPAALAPAVAGVASLHNFLPKPQSKAKAVSTRFHGLVDPSEPHSQVTFQTQGPCGLSTDQTQCFGLGPTDFATIYNVLPLWNSGIRGAGQTIDIANDSNINVQDVTDFRGIFGLPANPPTVVVNGIDPGKNGDEVEAVLDAEWSGAVAPDAKINLVVSKNGATSGVDLSAACAINGTSPCSSTPPAVLTVSFGLCEFFLGTTENANLNSMWQQANTEGITVLVSSGDDGSAGCDFANASVPDPAEVGLAVNGIASTPFDTAVGGTEFNDLSNPAQFWSNTNAANSQSSVLGYIPEVAYNDSCTNEAVVSFFFDPDAQTACNDLNVWDSGFVQPAGGSGGASSCTNSDFNTSNGNGDLSTCSVPYAKPSWQTALTPPDGKRDVPDVSLFSGDGLISGNFYVLCNQDFVDPNTGKAIGRCNLSTGTFLLVGGTSVAVQVMGGVVALIDQKNEKAQGNINPMLYSLAPANSCTSVANPVGTCMFYDVVNTSTNLGAPDTIAMPCDLTDASPNCSGLVGNEIGILTGYNAGPGYDLATGLGSINAANLVNASGWANTTSGNDFTISLSSSSGTVSSPGGTSQVTLTVTADGTFNDAVTIACTGLPSETTCALNPSITGSGQGTITFTTTAPSSVLPLSKPGRIGPGAGIAVFLLCALSLYLLAAGDGRRNRRWATALALLVIGVAFASFGCGGGSGGGGGGGGGGGVGGTPTGTSIVTITATSGSIQRSLQFTLTVN